MSINENVKMEDPRYCPKCNGDFKGSPIPEKYRKAGHYGPNPDTHYSLLIGIETPGYDGISLWKCPFCNHTWNRFHRVDKVA